MSDTTPEDSATADLGDQDTSAPASVGAPTDISAADLDVEDGAAGDTPATSDPDEFVEDADLGGTHGGSAGGAG